VSGTRHHGQQCLNRRPRDATLRHLGMCSGRGNLRGLRCCDTSKRILGVVSQLSWLGEWSAEAVRGALSATTPALAGAAMVLRGGIDANPEWSSGSAVVGGRFLAKFALSAPTARRLWHEAWVLAALGGRPGLRLPALVAACDDPVHLVMALTAGGPLSYDLVNAASGPQVRQIGAELAAFLAGLHQPATMARVTAALGRVGAPEPGAQATTGELRARLGRWIRPGQAAAVRRWCDWADDALARPGEDVFVHGDLHGYNQVWDQRRRRLRLVVDLETSGAADGEYDLRYVPALGPGVGLLLATAESYAARTGRPLSLDRVMAWHVRTALGDALWRSEAGIGLPDGGTPPGYVDQLAARFDALELRI